MFCHTSHNETVVLLQKKNNNKNKDKITIKNEIICICIGESYSNGAFRTYLYVHDNDPSYGAVI